MPDTVLITGANGFVGRRTVAEFLARGARVRAALRSPDATLVDERATRCVVGDIDQTTDWTAALQGVDVVCHLAARVHVMDDRCTDPLAEYRRVNVEGSLRLARAAAAGGVRRLVFVSSIKVNGEHTQGAPFSESSQPRPVDPYGISKWEAEQVLRQVADETGLEVVILRPPLMYGPGVRANFLRLLEQVAAGRPVPLGAVRNRRSFLFVGNFSDAIARTAEHPAAAGGTFLVSDGAPVSSAELVRALARALGRPARLLPVPLAMIRAGAALLGRGALVQRLLGSLEVDGSAIRQRLGWVPPYSMAEGLDETVRAWRVTR